jgi:hypothetical protein
VTASTAEPHPAHRTVRAIGGRAGPDRPAWLPRGLDEQLLAVALFDDERAAQVWADLRPGLDLEVVDWDQHRLLPLVERGLRRAGVADVDLPRLKGIHRQTWSRNQLLLNRTAPALAALAAAGIPTLVLKGGALGLRYYDDLGLRPMADLDVLVPFDQALDAVAVLDALGYEGEAIDRAHQLDHHGRPAEQPGGGQIDLHWQLNMALGQAGPPARWCDDFWAEALDLEVAGQPTRMLSPADLLLHVCVHGAGWDSGARLRWVTDAAAIVARAGTALDWDRLVDQAVRRRVVLPLRDTLGYLVDPFEVAVPGPVLRRLRATPTTRRDRVVYGLLTRPRPTPGRLGGLPITLGRFVTLTAHDPLPKVAVGLPGYLGRSWQIEAPAQLPARLAAKARGARHRS